MTQKTESSTPSTLARRARDLLATQLRDWPLLREHHARLAQSRFRRFEFDRFEIVAQFNPGRMFSAIAKLDARTIAGRPCALCDANRPREQATIDVGDGYVLMCNPHPILAEHYTLNKLVHSPQRILPDFGKMLDLARQLGDGYTVFYNGPQCGASSPDHQHFQAAGRGGLPIDREYDRVKRLLGEREAVSVFLGADYLRYFVGLESSDATALERTFTRLHGAYAKLTPLDDEPKMNLLCQHVDGVWRAIVFPRRKHRPGCYFVDEPARMLLSPGTVDIAGLVIMVREQDFERLTREQLAGMYDEITIDRALIDQVLAAVMAGA